MEPDRKNAYEQGWEMGKTIRLKCNDCNRTYDLNAGQGMKDHSLERVLGYFEAQTADMIRVKLSVLDENGSWSYRRMIGYCSSCRTFREIPTFHIIENNKEYVTAVKCQCGGICELIDDTDPSAIEDIKCPECGGNMSAVKIGMWD